MLVAARNNIFAVNCKNIFDSKMFRLTVGEMIEEPDNYFDLCKACDVPARKASART